MKLRSPLFGRTGDTSPSPTPRSRVDGGKRLLEPEPASLRGRHFYLTHVWLPFLAFAVLVVLLMVLGGDQWVADHVYAWQGHAWTLRRGFITDRLIHQAGRNLSFAAWLGVAVTWLVIRKRPGWSAWRRPLAYLLLCVAATAALVAWVKSFSNMDCPWDLIRYGGAREYVRLLELRPIGLTRGTCFPAGGASGGYAWVALYFFFAAVRPRLRWAGLVVGLAAGLAFGIAQQLRGAHFLSHDVWTLAISWSVALALYLAFLDRDPAGTGTDW